LDDIESKDLIRSLGKRRDTLNEFLKILEANKTDEDPLRKERLIHFLETTAKFMSDVYMFLQSQTLLNASYAKRHQITNDIISLLVKQQNDPLIKRQLSSLMKDYEQSF
jgi:predicted transcriptional regulator